MELLEQRILKEGRIYANDVLKVDSFLNHQLDVELLDKLAEEFYRLYANCGVNKILTVEANGIGVACLTARFFQCPALFAKKSSSFRSTSHHYRSKVHSYSQNSDHGIVVSDRYLTTGDKVLIIDDVLAHGSAAEALLDICAQAGAEVVGLGIVIEKAYDKGGRTLRERGIRVESLARIASMSPEDGIRFC